MSEHPDAYRQLGEDAEVLRAIREMEAGLTAQPRYYIPESEIRAREQGIEDGDVIAAVSTLDGLDIAHTGIAVLARGPAAPPACPPGRRLGRSLRTPRSPSGSKGFSSQMGIMVARPLAPE